MNTQFLTISLCSLGLALGVLTTSIIMISNNNDKTQVGHADVVTYNLEYSSAVGNYPVAVESGLEAKSRETTLHFENFVSNTNEKYVTSSEAAEHYIYNVQPISGITKLEVQASGNDIYLAASYNKLTLNDFKGNNRKDMLLFPSIGSGSLLTLNTSEVT